MKKVVFICLLSLSVCLGKPAEEQDHATVSGVPNATDPKSQPSQTNLAATPPAEVNNTSAQHTPTSDQSTLMPVETNSTKAQNNTAPIGVADASNNSSDTQTSQTKPTQNPNATGNAKNESVPVIPDNTMKTPATKPEETPKMHEENGTKPNADNQNNPQNGTKPDVSPAKKPNEVPNTNAPEPIQGRSFDGPSFIGGIILALGLLAVGFMGFKYYKNHTERNYHTL